MTKEDAAKVTESNAFADVEVGLRKMIGLRCRLCTINQDLMTVAARHKTKIQIHHGSHSS